jgi:hypothetical protein
MHKLTPEESRFLVKFALKSIPAGTLQDMQRGSAEKRAAALDLAVDVVLGHFAMSGHEIHRPDREWIVMPG